VGTTPEVLANPSSTPLVGNSSMLTGDADDSGMLGGDEATPCAPGKLSAAELRLRDLAISPSVSPEGDSDNLDEEHQGVEIEPASSSKATPAAVRPRPPTQGNATPVDKQPLKRDHDSVGASAPVMKSSSKRVKNTAVGAGGVNHSTPMTAPKRRVPTFAGPNIDLSAGLALEYL